MIFAGGQQFLQGRSQTHLDGTRTIPGHHRDVITSVWASGAAHETSGGLSRRLLDLEAKRIMVILGSRSWTGFETFCRFFALTGLRSTRETSGGLMSGPRGPNTCYTIPVMARDGPRAIQASLGPPLQKLLTPSPAKTRKSSKVCLADATE